jgi:hypothetical protein
MKFKDVVPVEGMQIKFLDDNLIFYKYTNGNWCIHAIDNPAGKALYDNSHEYMSHLMDWDCEYWNWSPIKEGALLTSAELKVKLLDSFVRNSFKEYQEGTLSRTDEQWLETLLDILDA